MLGPLVVAGILIDKKKLRKLSVLGVQDSKKLTPKKREDLFDKMSETNIILLLADSDKRYPRLLLYDLIIFII